MPQKMPFSRTTVVNGTVYYVGGILGDEDEVHLFHVYKYDPVKNEWSTLPPAPVVYFGVGRLNGKLVIVGGVSKEEDDATGDVHVFDSDTQQWVQSIPPMPTDLAAVLVTSHNSALIVCGVPDVSSPASVLIYNSQSSQWHSRAPPPLPFNTMFSSAVIINGKYYLAIGGEGDIEANRYSPVVFSHPLSTLLDPNVPQDPSIWQRMPDTPYQAQTLAATGGCLLALGGVDKDGDFSTAVHAYCPATSFWVKIGDLPDLETSFNTTTLSSGELFITGGFLLNDEHDELEGDRKVFLGIIS